MSLGESVRVEERDHVAVDEFTPINLLTAQGAEPVLQRRERTDPTGELDKSRPEERRQVQPSPAPSSEDKEPSQNGEQDESAMDYDYKIGQETVCHGYTAGMMMV